MDGDTGAGSVAVYASLDALLAMAHRCVTCCDGRAQSFHCHLCPLRRFKPTIAARLGSHYRTAHWKPRVEGPNGELDLEGARVGHPFHMVPDIDT